MTFAVVQQYPTVTVPRNCSQFIPKTLQRSWNPEKDSAVSWFVAQLDRALCGRATVLDQITSGDVTPWSCSSNMKLVWRVARAAQLWFHTGLSFPVMSGVSHVWALVAGSPTLMKASAPPHTPTFRPTHGSLRPFALMMRRVSVLCPAAGVAAQSSSSDAAAKAKRGPVV